jgi:hypothetical protein
MSLLDDGFMRFTAEIKDVQNGKQDCKVELKVKGPNINKTFKGKTGMGNGHAELDALHMFIFELQKRHVYKAIDDRIDSDLEEVDLASLTGASNEKINESMASNEKYIAKSTVHFFKKHDLTLTCAEKSVCRKCSSIMGNLGISPGEDTFKIMQNMDHTQYGFSNKVRDFIKAYLESKGRADEEIDTYFNDLTR